MVVKDYEKFIVDFIKKELVSYFLGYDDFIGDAWVEFVDGQKIGDCQLIVSFIDSLNIGGVKKHFGEIRVDHPIEDDGEIIDMMVHHWITINDNVYEFSKGTLKDYIDWEDLYSVIPDDDSRYHKL
jgi:hypothetical protein